MDVGRKIGWSSWLLWENQACGRLQSSFTLCKKEKKRKKNVSRGIYLEASLTFLTAKDFFAFAAGQQPFIHPKNNNRHGAIPFELAPMIYFLPFPLSRFKSSDQSESQARDLGFSGDVFRGEDLVCLGGFDGDTATALACAFH